MLCNFLKASENGWILTWLLFNGEVSMELFEAIQYTLPGLLLLWWFFLQTGCLSEAGIQANLVLASWAELCS